MHVVIWTMDSHEQTDSPAAPSPGVGQGSICTGNSVRIRHGPKFMCMFSFSKPQTFPEWKGLGVAVPVVNYCFLGQHPGTAVVLCRSKSVLPVQPSWLEGFACVDF